MMMAAEVSRQLKTSTATGSEGKRSHGGGPITRDFLGVGLGIESKELDLDLHVPVGWEKRLDLKSGNVYIQRCKPLPNTVVPKTTTTRAAPQHSSLSNLQDLNITPPTKPAMSITRTATTLSLFEDTGLDLKTPSSVHSSTVMPGPAMIRNYQSVCTLNKVKLALDRAWRDPPPPPAKKRARPSTASSILSASSSWNHHRAGTFSASSFGVDRGGSHDTHQQLESTSYNTDSSSGSSGGGLMVAAACPSCLLYVLVSKSNPKCPNCSAIITAPAMPKKPKIDLNISI